MSTLSLTTFWRMELIKLCRQAVKTCEARKMPGGVFTTDEFQLELQERLEVDLVSLESCRFLLAQLPFVKPHKTEKDLWYLRWTLR